VAQARAGGTGGRSGVGLVTRFDGKVALVTGAASGMGAATAAALAAESAHVVLFDVQPERVTRVAADVGGIAVVGDAARTSDAQHAVDVAVESFGGLDVLITCAGADVGGGALGDLTSANWEQALHANLETCVVTTKAALPELVRRRGAIAIVASIGAFTAGPSLAGYVAAKAGLLGLTRSLAVDYGPEGVRVNAVCPGWIDTPMVEGAMNDFARRLDLTAEEAYAQATAPLPLKRAGTPEEVAAVCLFLVSDDSSFMTGSSIVVDGGTIAANVGTAAFA
jgi:meso-butanediol dehydrogenase / (S,S)-butanediol dehydrogenase / diacetyl reductase